MSLYSEFMKKPILTLNYDYSDTVKLRLMHAVDQESGDAAVALLYGSSGDYPGGILTRAQAFELADALVEAFAGTETGEDDDDFEQTDDEGEEAFNDGREAGYTLGLEDGLRLARGASSVRDI